MDKVETEITTGSRLRSLSFQVKSIASMLRPGFTVPESITIILVRAAQDLQDLSAELEVYFRELLDDRRDRRMSSIKGSLKKMLRPPKRRR
jgi:hypothetical protein